MSEGLKLYAPAYRGGWVPPDPMTVAEWADRYRVLSSKGSAEPGPWRHTCASRWSA
jgi:phage terminase large subunit GpA-like protein